MTEVRLVLDYDDHEQGQTMEKLIEELAAKPESRELHSLIIGSWGMLTRMIQVLWHRLLFRRVSNFRI